MFSSTHLVHWTFLRLVQWHQKQLRLCFPLQLLWPLLVHTRLLQQLKYCREKKHQKSQNKIVVLLKKTRNTIWISVKIGDRKHCTFFTGSCCWCCCRFIRLCFRNDFCIFGFIFIYRSLTFIRGRLIFLCRRQEWISLAFFFFIMIDLRTIHWKVIALFQTKFLYPSLLSGSALWFKWILKEVVKQAK